MVGSPKQDYPRQGAMGFPPLTTNNQTQSELGLPKRRQRHNFMDMKLQYPRNTCRFVVITLLAMIAFGEVEAANYEESKVPQYELPDPLVCLDGSKVKDAETWRIKRRPEVLRLFENEMFGRSPGKPKAMRFEVVEKGEDALGGKAVRKQIVIHLGKGEKALAVNLLIYLPKNAKSPASKPKVYCFANSEQTRF